MRPFLLAFLLSVAACGSGGAPAPANDAAAGPEQADAGAGTVANKGAGDLLPPCPFENTTRWAGSIEGGRLLVTGNVDLQMAGFRPALTERSGGSPGTLALDLALAPEPNAAVTDLARYERSGARGYRRGEVWCGGARIAEFEIVAVD